MSDTTHTDIRAAIVQAHLDSDLALPTAYDNVAFTDKPASPAPWCKLKVVPVSNRVATLGDDGEDEHRGYIQLDLNFAMGEGEIPSTASADKVQAFYKAGRAFNSGQSTVHVLSCSRSPGREVEGLWRVSMTINYIARVPRAT